MRKPTPEISTDLLLAAATAAYRINGNAYVKADEYPVDKRPNSAVLTQLLITQPDLITAADQEKMMEMKTFIYQQFVIKILKSNGLPEFDNKILTLVSESSVPDAPAFTSIASYIPQYYKQELAKQDLQSQLNSASKTYLGEPNTKVSTTIEVVQMFYSIKYGCSFFTALTHDNKRVSFAYSGQTAIEVNKKYSIKAVVKRCDKDWVTVLGRVKPTKI